MTLQIHNYFILIRWLGIILGVSITCQLSAQNHQTRQTFSPSFEQLRLPGGDPGNSVQGIIQDSTGHIWFGTQGGLYRYDGREFVTFTSDDNNPNSLHSDYIEDIYLDSKGKIWLSHWFSGGLTFFDPDLGIFKRYVHNPDDPQSILSHMTSEIIEDKDGYIWVGGSDGLSRLDQETGTFKHFHSDPDDILTLSDNQVRGLYVDQLGTLWVATGMPWELNNKGGLNRYLPEKEAFERYLHDKNDPGSLTNNKVRAMLEDSRGNFWIGTAGDGLHTLDRETKDFIHFSNDSEEPGKISMPLLSDPGRTLNVQFSHITSIFEDRSSRLWITSAYSGLNVYLPNQDTTYHFERGPSNDDLKTNFIWQTFQSDDGTIWIATGGEGQAVYRVIEEEIIFPFFSTKELTGDSTRISHGITRDREGRIWMGLVDGSPLSPSDSRLWIIDESAGEAESIEFYKPDWTATTFDGFLSSITQDQSGNIWIGTNRGYFYGDGKQDFNFFKPDFVEHRTFGMNAILSTKSGEIWFPNWGSGVFKQDLQTKEFEGFLHDSSDDRSLFGPIVTAIFEDSKGNIWVGGGTPWFDPEQPLFLDRFIPETKTFEHYIQDHISTGAIVDITEDSLGNIWFIDFDDGLFKLDPSTKRLRKFTSFNSLMPQELLHWVFTHPNGDLWIGTDQSIIKMDPQYEIMTVYGQLHGVQPAENFWGAGWMSEDGELLVARNAGFHVFNPRTLTQSINSPLPDLRITGFRLLDDNENSPQFSATALEEPIWKTSKIELESFQNVFSFSVACFDFYQPDANQIQFMLEGFDRGWREDIHEGETPYYVNVDPGKYKFRLRGANSFGLWDKEGVSMELVVRPPWYKTWWAYALYTILLIATLFTIARVQRTRLIAREREKNRQRELDQAREIEKAYRQLQATQQQLVQSEKMASLGELTAGIAHEIQNPLNFVNNFSEVSSELVEELSEAIKSGDEEASDLLIDDICNNLKKIAFHGRRAEGIVKSMLQHSRTSSGVKEFTDLNGLCDEYVRLAYHGMRARDKSFQAQFELDLDPELPRLEVVPQDIGRVLLNLLNNAFQAVADRKDGKVVVTSFTEDGQVVIQVQDNGPGIPEEIKEKIFQPFFTTKPTGQGTGLGLSLSYDIVKAHGGEIGVANDGQGTRFMISIPIA